jgi:hypothetical protein
MKLVLVDDDGIEQGRWPVTAGNPHRYGGTIYNLCNDSGPEGANALLERMIELMQDA